MARITDRIKALEALLAPQPDRWAELARKSFIVPMTLEMLDDWHGYVDQCRASYLATGNTLDHDARPTYFFRNTEECEAVCVEQQRRLVEAGQADLDRAAAREAERKAAEPHPLPARERSSKPPLTFTPSTFPAFART